MTRQASSPVLVGRREELQLIGGALDGAQADRAALLLVGGEAGVGKTRLLEELRRRASERGFLVLVGACLDMGDGTFPFAPVADLLRDLRRQVGDERAHELLGEAGPVLGPLVPGLSHHGPASRPEWAAVLEHVRMLVERIVAGSPLVMVVEDLHWSDRSSRDVLSYLARGVRSAPLVLAVSYRTDDLHRRHPLVPFLAEIERAARPTRIDLGPLSEREVGELVAAMRPGRGAPDEVAGSSHEAAATRSSSKSCCRWIPTATAHCPPAFTPCSPRAWPRCRTAHARCSTPRRRSERRTSTRPSSASSPAERKGICARR